MRMYEFHPLIAAFLLTVLIMGLTVIFVLFPIGCIQWLWNGTVPHFSTLPQIAPWQAGLLYLAMATLLYLSGLIRIEIQTDPGE